ncbi:MAG: hypothetical protein HY420_02615 [Candidatus Kerfeldbacteria bacterium]|nr:hypothetical protein [Candidatus Kerfeldbacteria bacterium]
MAGRKKPKRKVTRIIRRAIQQSRPEVVERIARAVEKDGFRGAVRAGDKKLRRISQAARQHGITSLEQARVKRKKLRAKKRGR